MNFGLPLSGWTEHMPANRLILFSVRRDLQQLFPDLYGRNLQEETLLYGDLGLTADQVSKLAEHIDFWNLTTLSEEDGDLWGGWKTIGDVCASLKDALLRRETDESEKRRVASMCHGA